MNQWKLTKTDKSSEKAIVYSGKTAPNDWLTGKLVGFIFAEDNTSFLDLRVWAFDDDEQQYADYFDMRGIGYLRFLKREQADELAELMDLHAQQLQDVEAESPFFTLLTEDDYAAYRIKIRESETSKSSYTYYVKNKVIQERWDWVRLVEIEKREKEARLRFIQIPRVLRPYDNFDFGYMRHQSIGSLHIDRHGLIELAGILRNIPL